MTVTRRQFLAAAAAGTAGLAADFAHGGWTARSYERILGANDRVRVGIIGFSDRFRSDLLPSFLLSRKELNFELVAVSDLWSRRREEAAATLKTKAGVDVALARNNEELFERRDVDAVIISTADFQHALHPRRGGPGRARRLLRKALRRDDGRRPGRAQGRPGNREDRPDRLAAAQRRELHRRLRIPQVRQVRADHRGRDDLEREPAGPLAPARARRRDQGSGHRLEALPAEPALRALGSAEISRVPPLLALFLRNPGPVDVPPDRHRPLVHRPAPPAQRRRPTAGSMSGRTGARTPTP